MRRSVGYSDLPPDRDRFITGDDVLRSRIMAQLGQKG